MEEKRCLPSISLGLTGRADCVRVAREERRWKRAMARPVGMGCVGRNEEALCWLCVGQLGCGEKRGREKGPGCGWDSARGGEVLRTNALRRNGHKEQVVTKPNYEQRLNFLLHVSTFCRSPSTFCVFLLCLWCE